MRIIENRLFKGLILLLCIFCLGYPVISWAADNFRISLPPYQDSSSLTMNFINPLLANDKVKNAQCLLTNGDIDGAINQWKIIGSSTTEVAGFAHKQLGDILIKYKKDYREADKEYRMVAKGTVPAAPIIIGSAKLRLAYIKMHNNDYHGAITDFVQLAEGNQPMLYEDAYDAALRAAHGYQHIGDYDNAAKLFAEISKQPIPEKDAAYAQLQLCGVLWEQGKTKKTYNEKTNCFINSQTACQNLLKNFPDVDETTKGTAELLYLENCYFMEEYQRTIDLTNSWLTRYPQLKTQYITALGWLCISYCKTGQFKKCINICEEINNGTWKEEDQYKNFNVLGYAYLYEALAYEKLGDKEKAYQLRELCNKKYPNWYSDLIHQVK